MAVQRGESLPFTWPKIHFFPPCLTTVTWGRIKFTSFFSKSTERHEYRGPSPAFPLPRSSCCCLYIVMWHSFSKFKMLGEISLNFPLVTVACINSTCYEMIFHIPLALNFKCFIFIICMSCYKSAKLHSASTV